MRKREAGVTMVEMLVAIAIGAVVLLALAGIMSFMSRVVGTFNNRFAREQVRFTLRKRLDCPATIATLPVPCPNGTQIVLRDGAVILVGMAGTTYDDIELRAFCAGRPREFLVEFRQDGSPWANLFKLNPGCPPD